MHLWGATLSLGSSIFLFLALALALSFEFVNGFHDTANAVATVIYTHTLRPYVAVVWSGIWNLIGVLTSTGMVAYGIIALLPVELVINIGSSAGFAMVFALLLAAILWNLGTWYLGLPASSSHTLIGSILGVGLANSLISGHVFGEGINWAQAKNVGLSLIVSPVVGFCCAALLLLLSKWLVKRPELYASPEKDKAPPLWIRAILVLTCTGVSFAHGSNDGQKGMGLLMLILIGVVPGAFALRMDTDHAVLQRLASESQTASVYLRRSAEAQGARRSDAVTEVSSFLREGSAAPHIPFPALIELNDSIRTRLGRASSLSEISPDERRTLRTEVFLVSSALGKLTKAGLVTDPQAKSAYGAYRADLDLLTKYIPAWVKVAVALALGLGTMIGWKRIVVTVGEKIGKSHLTYAQGACAELVAMTTIGAADYFGLPVSTTHVLSSGIAGTMLANKSGLQTRTLRNLLLAWVLTLPVCIFLGASLFSFGLFIVLHVIR